MRIAHISDLHFGRISYTHVVEDLIQSIIDYQCDLVLVTGDLTQRARKSEFIHADQFFRDLPIPHLVVPGNHDLHAWWHRPDLRVFNPLRRYKKMISHELEPYVLADNVAILGLNTAHGLTIKSGKCTARHRYRIREFFSSRSPDTLKILAIHHPPATTQSLTSLDVARGGYDLLITAGMYGVDIICAGHWHLPFLTSAEFGGHKMLFSYSGTSSSDRWRASRIGLNSWNSIVEINDTLCASIHGYNPETRIFEKQKLFTVA